MITKIIKDHGIQNIMMLIPARPIRSIAGIKYTSSNDIPISIPMRISHIRYGIDSQKVEFIPIKNFEIFENITMYKSDINSLIEKGLITIYINHKSIDKRA